MYKFFNYFIIVAAFFILENCKDEENTENIQIITMIKTSYNPSTSLKEKIINSKDELNEIIKNYNIDITVKEIETLTKDINTYSIILWKSNNPVVEINNVTYTPQEGIKIYKKQLFSPTIATPISILCKINQKIPSTSKVTVITF